MMIGAVEGWAKLSGRTSTVPSLSEQQMVDCSPAMGCNGGAPSTALNWALANGICTSGTYPYTGREGSCKKCTPLIPPNSFKFRTGN
jgi:hypothetical protein